MSQLEKAFKKFYKAHQITKTKNILDMWHNKNYTFDTGNFAPKCVCSIFEMIGKPWSESALHSRKGHEQCYYVKQDMAVNFGSQYNYFTAQDEARKKLQYSHYSSCGCPCEGCFQFCIERYFNQRGGIKLRTKKKKSSL